MSITTSFIHFVGGTIRPRCLAGFALACWMSIMPAYGQFLKPPPRAATVTDRNGIDIAMEQGKFKELQDIASQNLAPEVHEYALAAYYRSIFDLDDSNTHLKKCLAIGKDMLDRNPVPVLLCGSMLAGNHYIQGDIRHWAFAAASTRDSVTPIITRITRTSNFVLPGISDVPLESYFQVPQMVPPSPTDKSFVIPRQGIDPAKLSSITKKAKDGVLEDKLPYIIGVKINDAMVPIWFDTGTSATALGEFTAKPSHVKQYSSSFIPLTNPFNGQTVQTYLGVADILTPGGQGFQQLSFHHFPLVISPDLKISALGMNAISKLGSLLIENNQIVVHPDLHMDCEETLHIASEPHGSPQILLSYAVNGKKEEILLDTGDNGYLSATVSASITGLSAPISGLRANFQRIEKVQYQTTQVTLGTGKHVIKRLIRYYPDRKAAAPYVMGSAALEDFNIFLDFDHGKACLLPK